MRMAWTYSRLLDFLSFFLSTYIILDIVVYFNLSYKVSRANTNLERSSDTRSQLQSEYDRQHETVHCLKNMPFLAPRNDH